MKLLTFLSLGLLLIGVTAAQANPAKPTVVVFYADWCGSCKILEPKLKEAFNTTPGHEKVEWVEFDLTDDTTKAATEKKADAKGLGDVYRAHTPKTGMAFLVAPSGESVTITKADGVAAMKQKLNDFIGNNS